MLLQVILYFCWQRLMQLRVVMEGQFVESFDVNFVSFPTLEGRWAVSFA
jgi:hypothetical protein